MTSALQIKLLAAILAVLGVIAGMLIHASRPVDLLTGKPPDATTQQRQSVEEQQFRKFIEPSKKHRLIP